MKAVSTTVVASNLLNITEHNTLCLLLARLNSSTGFHNTMPKLRSKLNNLSALTRINTSELKQQVGANGSQRVEQGPLDQSAFTGGL